MVNAARNRYTLILCFSILISNLFISKLHSQDYISQIDTSDYLPYPDGINTNLMIAASKGYALEIHRLMKLGADINSTDYDGISSLIFAVANNKPNTVKAILTYEPDIELSTNAGETALLITAKDRQIDIGEILLRAGADINTKDNHEATPLHYAAVYGYFYYLDLLLYYNADIEAKSEDGNSPLLSAVWTGYADIADILLQAGANPETTDNNGFTPLIIAAQNADTLIINLLINAGANLYSTNNYHYDALGIAIRNGHNETVDYLLRYYDLTKKADASLSPIQIARKYGRVKIINRLKQFGFKEQLRLNFDQTKIKAGIKTAFHDYYLSIGLSLKEPLYKFMINAGIDIKPDYSKVLVKESDNSFYQYMDKKFVLYTGIGKEFQLAENYYNGTLSLDINLNLAYMMTDKYKGTNIKAPDKIRFMPGAGLRWNKEKFNISMGYEYMKTELYRIGPHWLTISVSYDIYFDKKRGPIKRIKWY